MNGQIKRVLVTVKTYPNPSRKYGETVCVAGIDLDEGKWIRLYPIPFRDLDDEKRFKKYSIIEVRAIKAKDDARPESYKVEADSINIIGHIDTRKKDGWEKRKDLVLPTLSKSMCEILNRRATSDLSLGMFKPKGIDFIYQTARRVDEAERESCYAQLSFFNKKKNTVEAIPHDFRYRFFCENETLCPGHNLQIIDWEIGQSYRSWRWRYRNENVLLEKIKERWLDRMCALKNDVYFFVGNTKRFRDTFMVLGVFYPPRRP